MKKKSFLNGLYAKGALALTIVAGFTLAGCEKEDFSVVVPPIEITVPDPEIPEAKDGVAYVVLNATSASGNTLEDVKFLQEDGNEFDESKSFKGGETLKITAQKDGYTSVKKTVKVPALAKDAYLVISVDFVLTAVEEVTAPSVSPDPIEDKEPVISNDTQTFAGEYAPGELYTANVAVPVGTYYTAKQKEALLAEVAKLEVVLSRAEASDEDKANLAIAKKNLNEIINSLPTEAAKGIKEIQFKVKEAAKSVIFAIETTNNEYEVTFSTTVANKTYSVKGTQMQAGESIVRVTAEGVEIDHGHGHGHGNDGNAGGGIGGK